MIKTLWFLIFNMLGLSVLAENTLSSGDTIYIGEKKGVRVSSQKGIETKDIFTNCEKNIFGFVFFSEDIFLPGKNAKKYSGAKIQHVSEDIKVLEDPYVCALYIIPSSKSVVKKLYENRITEFYALPKNAKKSIYESIEAKPLKIVLEYVPAYIEFYMKKKVSQDKALYFFSHDIDRISDIISKKSTEAKENKMTLLKSLNAQFDVFNKKNSFYYEENTFNSNFPAIKSVSPFGSFRLLDVLIFYEKYIMLSLEYKNTSSVTVNINKVGFSAGQGGGNTQGEGFRDNLDINVPYKIEKEKIQPGAGSYIYFFIDSEETTLSEGRSFQVRLSQEGSDYLGGGANPILTISNEVLSASAYRGAETIYVFPPALQEELKKYIDYYK